MHHNNVSHLYFGKTCRFWLQLVKKPTFTTFKGKTTVVFENVLKETASNDDDPTVETYRFKDDMNTSISKHYKPFILTDETEQSIKNHPFAVWVTLKADDNTTLLTLRIMKPQKLPIQHIPEIIVCRSASATEENLSLSTISTIQSASRWSNSTVDFPSSKSSASSTSNTNEVAVLNISPVTLTMLDNQTSPQASSTPTTSRREPEMTPSLIEKALLRALFSHWNKNLYLRKNDGKLHHYFILLPYENLIHKMSLLKISINSMDLCFGRIISPSSKISALYKHFTHANVHDGWVAVSRDAAVALLKDPIPAALHNKVIEHIKKEYGHP